MALCYPRVWHGVLGSGRRVRGSRPWGRVLALRDLRVRRGVLGSDGGTRQEASGGFHGAGTGAGSTGDVAGSREKESGRAGGSKHGGVPGGERGGAAWESLEKERDGYESFCHEMRENCIRER